MKRHVSSNPIRSMVTRSKSKDGLSGELSIELPIERHVSSKARQVPSKPIHSMVTRPESATNPSLLLATLYTELSETMNINEALSRPQWVTAMKEELEALNRNKTWSPVPRTTDMNIVGSRWVLKTKIKSDGSLDRLKARLVAKGYNKKEGLILMRLVAQ